MSRRACIAFALGLCAGSLAADRPGNYVSWRPGLASASQPSAAWLAEVDAAKIDVVVNLAPPSVHGSIAEEGDIVRSRGVTYANIPVVFSKPTAEDFRRFSEVLAANKDRNVFVHCQVNLRGTAFTFLYRVIHEGADPRESMAKLTSIWAPDPVWKRFIEETLAANGKSAEIL